MGSQRGEHDLVTKTTNSFRIHGSYQRNLSHSPKCPKSSDTDLKVTWELEGEIRGPRAHTVPPMSSVALLSQTSPTPSPFSSFPNERDSDSRSAKTVGPHFIFNWGFPGGSEGKEPVSNGEDLRSTPGSGRSPGEGEGHPHQYSCLGNPMDRGAWGATVHGVAKNQTQLKQLSRSAHWPLPTRCW